jgi:two-component system sensor histidine kinase HydH
MRIIFLYQKIKSAIIWVYIGSFVLSFVIFFITKTFLLSLLVLVIGLVLFIIFLRHLEKSIVELAISTEKLEEMSNLLYKKSEELEERTAMLRQKTEELSSIGEISKAMVSTMELNNILEIILTSISKNLKFDRAMVFLVNEADKCIEGEGALGIPQEVIKNVKLSFTDKDNPIVRAVVEARPVIISSIEKAGTTFQRIFSTAERGNSGIVLTPCAKALFEIFSPVKGRERAVACVPLVAKDKVVGLLVVDNCSTQREIQEEDLRALVTYTNQAGLAIENARLYNTERKFKEELQRQVEIIRRELEAAQEQIIRAEKLATLGEMAAIVAHEVRNPMAAIRGSAQRISQKLPPDDMNRKYTGFIMNEVDRLERIVKNMLLYSKQPEPAKQQEDINQFIEDTLSFMSDEFEKNGVKLVKELDPMLPLVPVDSALLRQVVINIIQNAFYFLQNLDGERMIKVSTHFNINSVEIKIGDNGPGVPDEIKNKIFEPFFTTKSAGTGLGLAICQRIVEAHNGKIYVEDTYPNNYENKGATFVIRLPLP